MTLILERATATAPTLAAQPWLQLSRAEGCEEGDGWG